MYRTVGKALLRAARAPMSSKPDEWPDLTDDNGIEQWRAWLAAIWSRDDTAEAVRLASPNLAQRLEDILAGTVLDVKSVRRATVSVVRYLLRETARPTPFGLFAGVAPIEFGPAAKARWGDDHRPIARVDAQWLTDVVQSLEACPELLERLPVTVTNLRSIRGERVVLPNGPGLTEIRRTSAIRAVECAARAPVRFAALVAATAERFPAAAPATVRSMLAELVTHRFLITCLRPPAIITDPLGFVLKRLDEARADEVVPVAPTVRELRAIHADLDRHNHAETGDRAQVRAAVAVRMRGLSGSGRTPLTVDLWLDCDVTLPEQVAREMETAAGALLRLTAQPGGPPAWRDYYAAFIQRYGVGAMVRLHDVVNPDTGIGLPAGYPGSLLEPPLPPTLSDRDDRLLALVHRAAWHGYEEIVLDDDTISDLAAVGADTAPAPPHVELSARLHTASPDALKRGEFTLTVSPARAAGTMTGRFTAGNSALAEAFRNLPTNDTDAIPAQLSFPPTYPHAENVTRTPRFLRHIIALGEPHDADDDGVIPLDDLAVTADRHRLRLIWRSQGCPVEPQVFHALAMDKQAPPLARFLSALSRAHTAFYTELDWGAAARLTYLPRVRYRRAILSAARWRLQAADLPPAGAAWPVWRAALDEWRQRWRLPGVVELRDDDRALRLDLDQPAHLAVLRAQLQRTGHAVLTEAGDDTGHGWLDGHAHEIAVPLVSTRTAAPSPLAAGRRHPLVEANTYGHLPGSPESRWLFAKLFVHQGRQTDVIAAHLPRLLADLGDCPQWWFVRYRSAHEADHLRLRFHVAGPAEYGACAAVVGAWTHRMRRDGLVGRLVLDTYYPELGRYGEGSVLAAAEQLFVADSQAVLTQLRHQSETAVHPGALAAANLVHIAYGFCGGAEAAMAWLIARADTRPAPAARAVLDQAVALADPSRDFTTVNGLPGGDTLIAQWIRRRETLNAYRRLLPHTMDHDDVLESLLHMHHVRAIGIDRERERTYRRLARAVALGWQARRSAR